MPVLTSQDRIGSVLEDRYSIDRILGEGGMGVVFAGTDRRLGRRVALKLLHPHLAQEAELRARFDREARAAATLNHPNVVTILTNGVTDDGAPYMVMEFLEGESLGEYLEKRNAPVNAADAFAMLGPVMDAVAMAHQMGIVHRDIKPDNIFLVRSPRGVTPKIVDFGIAKVAVASPMTQTGAVVGTPAYMSPEQVMGARDLGPPADVWSMGVVLYEVLSGHLHVSADGATTPMALLAIVLTSEPVRIELRLPAIHPELARVVHKALARELAHRYHDMGEFHADLSNVVGSLGSNASTGSLASSGDMFANTLLPDAVPAPQERMALAAAHASSVDISPATLPMRRSVSWRTGLIVSVAMGVLVAAATMAMREDVRAETDATDTHAASGVAEDLAARERAIAARERAAELASTEAPGRGDARVDAGTREHGGGAVRAAENAGSGGQASRHARAEGGRGRGASGSGSVAAPAADEPGVTQMPTTPATRTPDATPSGMTVPAEGCYRDIGNGIRVRVACGS